MRNTCDSDAKMQSWPSDSIRHNLKEAHVATYIISYDLDKAGQNYKTLYDAIKSYGTWWHHLDSTWCIVTQHTVEEVTGHLSQCLDNNDSLLVMKTCGVAAWTSFGDEGDNWLKEFI